MRQSILIVSKSVEYYLIIRHVLETDGFNTMLSQDYEESINCVEQFDITAVIVDCRKDDKVGEELCIQLKSSMRPAPLFLALIEQGAEALYFDLVKAGADRCFHRPFEPLKLLEYLRANLKSGQRQDIQNILQDENLDIDIRTRKVLHRGKDLHLGALEFNLLLVLTENAGTVLKREELIKHAWPSGTFVDDRTVDVHIGNLRKALRQEGREDFIRTVRGVGYAIEPNG